MRNFQSKFYLNTNILLSLIFLLLVFEVINSENIFNLNLSKFNKIAFVLSCFSFISSLFYIFYETHSRKKIFVEHKRLKNLLEIEKDARYKQITEKELLFNQKLFDELNDDKNYSHKLKSLDKIFDNSNGMNYILLILTLIGAKWNYTYSKTIEAVLFESMIAFTFLFFCLFSVIYDLIKNKKFTGISVGAGVVLSVIFSLIRQLFFK